MVVVVVVDRCVSWYIRGTLRIIYAFCHWTQKSRQWPTTVFLSFSFVSFRFVSFRSAMKCARVSLFDNTRVLVNRRRFFFFFFLFFFSLFFRWLPIARPIDRVTERLATYSHCAYRARQGNPRLVRRFTGVTPNRASPRSTSNTIAEPAQLRHVRSSKPFCLLTSSFPSPRNPARVLSIMRPELTVVVSACLRSS